MHPLVVSPLAEVLLLTAGILLLAVEANRPGWIVPGTAGLVAVLAALGSVMRSAQGPQHTALLVVAGAALLWELKQPTPWRVAAGSALWLAVTLWLAPRAVTAICAAIVGVSVAGLGRIARRARQNKGLD